MFNDGRLGSHPISVVGYQCQTLHPAMLAVYGNLLEQDFVSSWSSRVAIVRIWYRTWRIYGLTVDTRTSEYDVPLRVIEAAQRIGEPCSILLTPVSVQLVRCFLFFFDVLLRVWPLECCNCVLVGRCIWTVLCQSYLAFIHFCLGCTLPSMLC